MTQSAGCDHRSFVHVGNGDSDHPVGGTSCRPVVARTVTSYTLSPFALRRRLEVGRRREGQTGGLPALLRVNLAESGPASASQVDM